MLVGVRDRIAVRDVSASSNGDSARSLDPSADTLDQCLRHSHDSDDANRGVNGLTIFPVGQLQNGWTVYHLDMLPCLYGCSSLLSDNSRWIAITSTLSGYVRFIESLDDDPSAAEGRTRIQLEFELQDVKRWQEVSHGPCFSWGRARITDLKAFLWQYREETTAGGRSLQPALVTDA